MEVHNIFTEWVTNQGVDINPIIVLRRVPGKGMGVFADREVKAS
jgi:hypothetical protein